MFTPIIIHDKTPNREKDATHQAQCAAQPARSPRITVRHDQRKRHKGGATVAHLGLGANFLFFFFIFGFFLNFSGVLVANTQPRRPNKATKPPTDARELATNWGVPFPQLAAEPPNGALKLGDSMLKSLYFQGAKGRNREMPIRSEVVDSTPD